MKEKKTNYHKILGIVYLVVVFAAVVSLIYYYQVSNQPYNPFSPSNRQPAQQTYVNNEYRLEFTYLDNQKLDTSGMKDVHFRTGGKNLANVSIPQRVFPSTNFASADINISLKEGTTLADCQTYVTPSGSNKRITTSVRIDSGNYYTDSYQGAAAGTVYDTKIYRMLHNDICYEAVMTVGISNIENYETGTITEVVEADVWNALSCILNSLKPDNFDISKWKTYTNAKYGYSFKYPANAEIINNDGPGSTTLSRADSAAVGVNRMWLYVNAKDKLSAGENLKQYVDKVWKLNKNDPNPNVKNKEISSIKTVLIDGMEAYQFTLKGSFATDAEGSGYVIDKENVYTYVADGSQILELVNIPTGDDLMYRISSTMVIN